VPNNSGKNANMHTSHKVVREDSFQSSPLKGNTPRVESEDDDDEKLYSDRRSRHSRKRSIIKSKSSVSKIFAMGDKRSHNLSRHSAAISDDEDD
jgi:hypothetical protein